MHKMSAHARTWLLVRQSTGVDGMTQDHDSLLGPQRMTALRTNRRNLLRYAGGTMGLAAAVGLGFPALRAGAQDATPPSGSAGPGPSEVFNNEGTPPTEATGTVTVALQFDPLNLDS